MDKGFAIFIVPRASTSWKGNEAGWITASGWAQAGETIFGESFVATTDGVFNYRESRNFPVKGNSDSNSIANYNAKHYRRFIPEVLITLIKDIKLYFSKPKALPIEDLISNASKPLKLVWQRHDLFSPYGYRLAKKHGVPYIISVEAAVVWEAKKWGIKRPIWGKLLERFDESKKLKKADFVVCVSEELKAKMIELGVSKQKILVSPNKVDLNQFNLSVEGKEIRVKYGLEGNIVIGWTGSFRSFHGLEDVIKAFSIVSKNINNARLLLVGDGILMSSLQELVKSLDIAKKVIFAGRVPFTEVNKYVAAFDLAIVSAQSSKGFHYSPLKLREYMACGKPVIIPKAGDLPNQYNNNKDVLFYSPGDLHELANQMNRILTDEELKRGLIEQSIKLTENEGSWDFELNNVLKLLNKIQN